MYAALAMSEAVYRILVRLPDELRGVLLEAARRNERSLNGQIVYLLRRAIDAGFNA